MKRKILGTFFSLLSATLIAGSASAANIAWVSFHNPDGTPSAGAAAEGYTQAPDIGYTNVLTAAGHTVTRFTGVNNINDGSAASIALREGLNAPGIDLVIISRSNDSGLFQTAAEATVWNTDITKKMIHMGGYALRQSRLGFVGSEVIPDTLAAVKLVANAPTHPIFAGVALDGSNTMVNDYTTGIIVLDNATNPMTAQRGVSMNELPIDAVGTGGTLIASLPAGAPGGAPTGAGNLFIAEWLAGTSISKDTGAQTFSRHRMVFLSGSREQAANGSSQQAGMYDLTATGETMFLNAVAYMAAVPEPATPTLVMFALAGLGLVRRRTA
jgi:hypothetical protein